MSKILGKLFGGAAGSFIDKIASVADKFITTGAEKQAFQKEMTKILIDAEAAMQKNVTERWQADLEHGNWLTRSVRPLVLVFLIISTVIMVYVDSGSTTFNVDSKWVEPLST